VHPMRQGDQGAGGLIPPNPAAGDSPRAYVVSYRAIEVERLIGNVQVPLEGVRETRRINTDDLRGCIRLWASGGLFGYYGLFRTARLGRCTWYVTNRKNVVVIIAQSKTTLYSPDDVDGFLEAIRISMPVREA
jgi:Bacterial PH domain